MKQLALVALALVALVGAVLAHQGQVREVIDGEVDQSALPWKVEIEGQEGREGYKAQVKEVIGGEVDPSTLPWEVREGLEAQVKEVKDAEVDPDDPPGLPLKVNTEEREVRGWFKDLWNKLKEKVKKAKDKVKENYKEWKDKYFGKREARLTRAGLEGQVKEVIGEEVDPDDPPALPLKVKTEEQEVRGWFKDLWNKLKEKVKKAKDKSKEKYKEWKDKYFGKREERGWFKDLWNKVKEKVKEAKDKSKEAKDKVKEKYKEWKDKYFGKREPRLTRAGQPLTIAGHSCRYMEVKWQTKIIGVVTCPGWTDLLGRAFSEDPAMMKKATIRNFVDQAIQAGLITEGEVLEFMG